MIKQLGTLGFFVKSNLPDLYKVVTIYSSSAKSVQLFSASINSGSVVIPSVTSSVFVNGTTSGVLKEDYWGHVSFSFFPPLQTTSDNNFSIDFGGAIGTDFNIQNIYIMQGQVSSTTEALQIHTNFVGGPKIVSNTKVTASADIVLNDSFEDDYINITLGKVYQPSFDQKKFLLNVQAAGKGSCVAQFSRADNSYILQSDEFYVDNTLVQSGDYVLSNLDNKVVLISSSARFSTVSTTTGDVVHVLSGIQNGEDFFVKSSSGSWTKIDFQEKFDIVES
jgi:hypothetical protein